MAVKTILQLGDPLLREKAVAVTDPQRARSTTSSTISPTPSPTGAPKPATDAASPLPNSASCSASSSCKLPGVEPWPLINPEIIERSEEKIIVWDACLSFLSIFMQVERHRQITVRYQNLDGETLEFEAGDDRNLSELLQHEIDHLDGILAIDRVVDIKTICTREEFEKRYRDASPYAVAPAE